MVSMSGGMGVIEVTKEYLRTSVDGFCVANAMKITNINLTKILVCSPRLFLLKKLSNFVCWGHSKTTLGISINKEMIIGWWIDEVRFTSCYFGWEIWIQRCVTF